MNKKTIARSKMMDKKKLVKSKQAQRVEQQLKDLKENGLIFPTHNPLPQRHAEMSRGLRKVNGKLRYEEKKRKEIKAPTFTIWEYKKKGS